MASLWRARLKISGVGNRHLAFSGEEYGTWTLGGSLDVDANGPMSCIDEGLIDPNVFCPPKVYRPGVWVRWGDVFQFLRGYAFRRCDLMGRGCVPRTQVTCAVGVQL